MCWKSHQAAHLLFKYYIINLGSGGQDLWWSWWFREGEGGPKFVKTWWCNTWTLPTICFCCAEHTQWLVCASLCCVCCVLEIDWEVNILVGSLTLTANEPMWRSASWQIRRLWDILTKDVPILRGCPCRPTATASMLSAPCSAMRHLYVSVGPWF